MERDGDALARHRAEFLVAELIERRGDLDLFAVSVERTDDDAVLIADALAADDAHEPEFIERFLRFRDEAVELEGNLGDENDMRRVFRVFLGERGGGGKPSGVATDRLEDDERVDLLHIARENARLLDRKRDVTRRGREARRMVRREEVVVDRLRDADAAKVVALRFAVFFDAADRVHRVVAAREEVVANVVLLELLENARKIGFLNLMTATSKRASRRRFETLDDFRRDRRKVENLILHEPFDPVLHSEDFVHLGVGALLSEFETALNDTAKARVNDAGRSAALTDDHVALKHGDFS